jgi:hypothetical protein
MDAITKFNTLIRKESNGCWTFIGPKSRGGYGLFKFNGRLWRAHRFSAEYLGGMCVANLNVCHQCDNTSCVNPDHLWTGTHLDNMLDRNNKKRQACGVRHGLNKHSEETVRAIKIAYSSQTPYRGQYHDLARQFEMHPMVVYQICKNQRWKHVKI